MFSTPELKMLISQTSFKVILLQVSLKLPKCTLNIKIKHA